MSQPSPWIDTIPADDLPEGAHRCAVAAGKPVVVIHAEGELHAIANVCPHAGQPLGEGEMRGRLIVCPFHGYAYDVRTGRNRDFPHDEPPVKTYPVRIADGMIQVQVT